MNVFDAIRYFGFVIAPTIIGVLFVAAAAFIVVRDGLFLLKATRARGVVLWFGKKPCLKPLTDAPVPFAQVAFRDAEGTRREAPVHNVPCPAHDEESSSLSPGDAVSVYWIEGQPDSARSNGVLPFFVLALPFAGMAMTVLVLFPSFLWPLLGREYSPDFATVGTAVAAGIGSMMALGIVLQCSRYWTRTEASVNDPTLAELFEERWLTQPSPKELDLVVVSKSSLQTSNENDPIHYFIHTREGKFQLSHGEWKSMRLGHTYRCRIDWFFDGHGKLEKSQPVQLSTGLAVCCSECRHAFLLRDEEAGLAGECPACQASMEFPVLEDEQTRVQLACDGVTGVGDTSDWGNDGSNEVRGRRP